MLVITRISVNSARYLSDLVSSHLSGCVHNADATKNQLQNNEYYSIAAMKYLQRAAMDRVLFSCLEIWHKLDQRFKAFRCLLVVVTLEVVMIVLNIAGQLLL